MADAHKNPSPDLALKVHWPRYEGVSTSGQRVVIEIQFADGDAVASMSVPNAQLLQGAAQRLAHYPLISPAGLMSIVSDEITIPQQESRAISLDQLVANAVSMNMLDDEPDAAAMLAEFRARLLKSLEHIYQAIASLTKDWTYVFLRQTKLSWPLSSNIAPRMGSANNGSSIKALK